MKLQDKLDAYERTFKDMEHASDAICVSNMTAEELEAHRRRVSHHHGILGGAACIRDTRIGIWTIVNLWKLGASNEDVLQAYPGLMIVDLDAAASYYEAHKQEIDDRITLEEGDDE